MAKRKSNKQKQKKEIIFCTLVALVIAGGFFVFESVDRVREIANPSSAAIAGVADFAVHFIDVGQGDSALITADDYNILIDAGENNKGVDVVKYLADNDIDRLDMIVSTHPHSDHIGGLDIVINELDVDKVLINRLPDSMVPTSKTYTDFLESVKNKGIKLTAAAAGQEYEFGKGKLTVVGPVESFDELNNTSLVVRFEYENKAFLFTGDMEKEAENSLLEAGATLSSNVLKLGHHGSKTSTSQAFLDAVNPQAAVISVGANNSYNHPNDQVLNRLDKKKVTTYRTDHLSTVIFSLVDGELITIE